LKKYRNYKQTTKNLDVYDDKKKVGEAMYDVLQESSIFDNAVTAGRLQTKYDKGSFVKAIESGKLDYSDFSPSTWKKVEDKILSKGYLYKGDIPDEAIGKMLDWDKPLSQQPESVRKALDNKRMKFASRQELIDAVQKIDSLIESIKSHEDIQTVITNVAP